MNLVWLLVLCFLRTRRPTRSTRTETLLSYTTLYLFRRLDPRESRRGDLDLGNRLAARAGQRWKPELAGLFRRARYRLMAWTAAPPDQPGGEQEQNGDRDPRQQRRLQLVHRKPPDSVPGDRKSPRLNSRH